MGERIETPLELRERVAAIVASVYVRPGCVIQPKSADYLAADALLREFDIRPRGDSQPVTPRITRVPLTIVSTLDGARTEGVLVGVLASDLDAFEVAAGRVSSPPPTREDVAEVIASVILPLDPPRRTGVSVADVLIARGWVVVSDQEPET